MGPSGTYRQAGTNVAEPSARQQLSGRGLAYWTDGKDERIWYVTPGYRLVALDAKTGIPVAAFGTGGIVDLKRDFDQQLDLVNAKVGLLATPVVARDVVIVGAAFETGANPKSKTNVKGYVRGFDVRTGKRLWIFHTILRLGEFGNDTWQNDSWAYTGNTGVWAQISVDEELGIAYLPVELPTHDYYGGERPGANLFSESLVAVDLGTGQRKWHYQTNWPGGSFDPETGVLYVASQSALATLGLVPPGRRRGSARPPCRDRSAAPPSATPWRHRAGWSGGKVVRASDQFGRGMVTGARTN